MKKIVIFGSNGQVGSELTRLLKINYKIYPLTRRECDITNKIEVESFVNNIKPQIIINAAAYTKVDDAEENELLATQINADSLKHICEVANSHSCLLIHFSTDYVFSGLKKKAYLEKDITNPINIYGKTKLLGEQEIQLNCDTFAIFRTCWVYGKEGKNFVEIIRNLLSRGEELKVVSDQFGTPTSAKLIAEVINRFIHEWLLGKVGNGIYHLTANGSCSWYEFACEIKNILENNSNKKIKSTITEVGSKEFQTKAKRPNYSILDNSLIKTKLNISLKDWKSYLKQYLKS